MKKLIMAALVVAACASTTYGASFQWKTKNSKYVYQAGTSTKLGSGTAYIFDAAQVTQASLVSALAAGTLDLSSESYLDSSTLSSGAIAVDDATTYGTNPNTYSLYFAVMDGDKLFISEAASYTAPAGADTMQVQFNPTTASKNAAALASSGYTGSSWYSVPEPCSGLLMLVGMGALALRRRRA